jgi:type IV pilus assembly protein PilW
LEFIGREIRQAGYRGCFSSNDQLNELVDPIPYEFNVRYGIQGFEAVDDIGNWTPALTMLPNTSDANSVYQTTYGYGADSGIDITGITNGTDVITFRHLSQTDARLGGYTDAPGESVVLPRSGMPTSGEEIVVGVEPGWAEFDRDHLVMIHDCEKATIFRVTTNNGWARNGDGSPGSSTGADGTTKDLIIGHDTANPAPGYEAYKNNSLRLALVNTFGLDAAVTAIESHTFFIASGAGKNNDGKNPLSLWRKSGLEAPIELVEGVENLQILYGEDTDQDNVPNQYREAHEVIEWTNVITIRITVIVNSIDNVGSTSVPGLTCADRCVDNQLYDGLIRRSFTQTIQIRNNG